MMLMVPFGGCMLIKFQSDNDEFHDRLLAATGLGTVTGAYRSAAVQFPGLQLQIRSLKAQLDEVKLENTVLRQVLYDAREAAIALSEKALPPGLDSSAERYLQTDYVLKSWSMGTSPHSLMSHASSPDDVDGRVYQHFEFSNGGILAATFKSDGSDMQILELSKLSLSFIPGDEDRTFSIEFFTR